VHICWRGYRVIRSEDRLFFFEIETVVRKFGYQPGDLIYYWEPNRDLDDGLVLLTSHADVIKMAEVHLGHKLVHYFFCNC
jgi:hypothetical protein